MSRIVQLIPRSAEILVQRDVQAPELWPGVAAQRPFIFVHRGWTEEQSCATRSLPARPKGKVMDAFCGSRERDKREFSTQSFCEAPRADHLWSVDFICDSKTCSRCHRQLFTCGVAIHTLPSQRWKWEERRKDSKKNWPLIIVSDFCCWSVLFSK